MGPNKYIQLMFAAGALLLAFLTGKTVDWVWSIFAKPNELVVNGAALAVGVIAGIATYRSEKVFGAAQEVVRELEKVTWPTRKETSAATLVVIVAVSVAAVILSVFDAVWSFLTGRIFS